MLMSSINLNFALMLLQTVVLVVHFFFFTSGRWSCVECCFVKKRFFDAFTVVETECKNDYRRGGKLNFFPEGESY